MTDGKSTRRAAAAAGRQARIGQMREATAVAGEFAAANREAAASVRELQAALDELAGMTAAVMARHPAKAVVAAAVDAVAGGAAMSITPEENLAQWLQIRARARLGAAAAAEAMVRYIADRTASDTLRRTTHAPGAYYKARPGAPPASASGTLAKSMYWTPASGELRATAMVGNSARHAKILEFGGCVLQPTSGKVMHWTDTGGSWYHSRLPAQGEYPAHPFLSTTIEEAIADGSLRQVAIDEFRKYDP